CNPRLCRKARKCALRWDGFFIYNRLTDGPRPLRSFLALDDLAAVSEWRPKYQVALMCPLFHSLHNFTREVTRVKFRHADQEMLHEEVFWSIGADHRFGDRD